MPRRNRNLVDELGKLTDELEEKNRKLVEENYLLKARLQDLSITFYALKCEREKEEGIYAEQGC